MAEEQTPQGVQDPVQPAAPAPATPAQQQTPQYNSDAPWSQDLSRFGDKAAEVDAYLRERWQPRVTQLEQRYAETEAARQMLNAFEADPHAANVSVQRQLYGDEYADALAVQLGRSDLVVGQPQQPQQTQAQPQQTQQEAPQGRPGDPVYDYWAERYQQEQYDSAKADFLGTVDASGQRLYADINPELFDPFVAGAETWEEAVNNYRSYAAQFAQGREQTEAVPAPPPTIGSETGGTVGSTPSYPKESLNEAIDAIFSENQPIAPPVMGSQ